MNLIRLNGTKDAIVRVPINYKVHSVAYCRIKDALNVSHRRNIQQRQRQRRRRRRRRRVSDFFLLSLENYFIRKPEILQFYVFVSLVLNVVPTSTHCYITQILNE